MRRFGPINGAGVVVIEKESQGQIVPSDFGTTLYVGATERGEIGEVIDCPNQNAYLRKCGGFLTGSEVPDNAFDFYDNNEGRGRLFVIRATDGLEVKGVDLILSRHNGTGEYLNRATQANQKRSLLQIDANNGGRWAGAERVLGVDFTIATDLTETTLDTSQTMLIDEFKGATIQLLGVTSRTYKVISNDVAGVLTVESDSTMAADLAAENPTFNTAVIYLDTEIRETTTRAAVAGDRKALTLIWKDGEEDQNTLFGLDVLIDGVIIRSYPNLSMDPVNKWFIETVVNEDLDNDFIVVTSNFAGTFTTETRPANWSSNYQAFAGQTLTMEIAHVRSVTPVVGTNDVGFVTDFIYPSKTVRQRITLTFTGAAAFTVASVAANGAEFLNLPAGVVDSPYAVELAADDKAALDFFPTFTVRTGVDAWAAGDVIVIDVEPLPIELNSGTGVLDGVVLLDGSDPNSLRAGIDSNTVSTITLKNVPSPLPTVAADITAAPVSSGVITFATAGGTIDLITDTLGAITLTYGVEANIAALVATLNADAIVQGLPAVMFSGAGDLLTFELVSAYAPSSANKGEDQYFEIVTIPAELNITAGTFTGVTGDTFRVESERGLRDGYDGDTPSDANISDAAFITTTSPINNLRGRNVGLVKLATPGVTSTSVQQAGLNYAAFRNYQYRVEIPASIVTEESAVNYINNTIGRNDYGVTIFPSFANVRNKQGNGTVLQSMTGGIHGREARVASDFLGYHKAAAGIDINLPNVVSLPTGEKTLNEEILNKQGISVVKKRQGSFIIWGDRTIALDPNWKFKHAREYISHIENVLLENFDFIIFALNDAQTRRRLFPIFRTFFLPEFQKRAVVGPKFEDAVGIKIDEENNTPADIEAGDLNAALRLRVVGVVERFKITVSRDTGVEATASA